MLYFTVENTPSEKAMFQLKNLINIIHQNFLILGHFISLKLKDKDSNNVQYPHNFLSLNFVQVWVSRLFELLEYDPSSNFPKSENYEKMGFNNNYLCTLMKNL